MKHTRIINGVAVDTRVESPAGYFTPNIAAEFVACPDEVQDGWIFADGTWAAPDAPAPWVEPAPTPPQVTLVQFKLLFTPAERVAIKAARATDAMIDDFYEIVEDPRLTMVDFGLQSTVDGVGYLVSRGLITEARKDEIISGVLK